MIIGSGLMAIACNGIDREDVLFFASGVSDSSEKDDREFQREENMLFTNIEKYHNKVFIYFGAIGGGELYLRHKYKMQSIILQKTNNFIILNLSQVVGHGGNANTLFNAFRKSLLKGEEIKVYRDCFRSLIDIDDVMMILDSLIELKYYGVHNFYGIESLPVDLIVQLMAESLGVKARMVMTAGNYVRIDNSIVIQRLIKGINTKNYTKNLIEKYI